MIAEKPFDAKWQKLKTEVDQAAAKEKSQIPPIYEAAISLARRPLVANRFILLTLLDNLDPEEAKKALGIGGDKPPYAHDPPKLLKGFVVLDPFAGSGSIPLEAARLGAKAIALEYSPVQWAALKVIEIAKRRPDLLDVEEWRRLKKKYRRGFIADMEALCREKVKSPLLAEGCRVVKELAEELSHMYPPHEGKRVAHYIWAKRVKCPKCGRWVPLAYSFQLDEDTYWQIREDGTPEIRKGKAPPGTIKRGEATCPYCKFTVSDEYVKKNIKGNDALVAIRTEDGAWHPPTPQQIAAYENLPEPARLEEPISPNDPRSILPPLYGYTRFGDLFNKRQHTILNALVHKLLLIEDADMKTVLTWLVPKHADYNSVLTSWHKGYQKVKNTLAFKVLTMSWDYVEVNPFARGSGSLWSMLYQVIDGFAFLLEALRGSDEFEVHFGSVLSLPFPDKSIRYVVTDPPYFDNIPYPEVYDFVYVWLKRVLADVYPDVFGFYTLWRDRSAEDISVGGDRGAEHYELLMRKALGEIRRVLRDDGVLVMYFAHSKRDAWIYMMRQLYEAGFAVVNAFPIASEGKSDIHGRGKVSFTSSIVIVARPRRVDGDVGYVERLGIDKAVERAVVGAWEAGVRRAELFMVAYAEAMRIATAKSVLKSVRGGDVIEDVISFAEEAATRAIVSRLFGSGQADAATRFYIFVANNYGGVMSSDDFLVLSRLTVSRHELERAGLVRKRGEVVELVDFVDRCDRAGRFGYLVDAAHRVLCAFKEGGRSRVEAVFQQSAMEYSLEDICRVVEAVYGGGWGVEREVVNNFSVIFCRKSIKEDLTKFIWQ